MHIWMISQTVVRRVVLFKACGSQNPCLCWVWGQSQGGARTRWTAAPAAPIRQQIVASSTHRASMGCHLSLATPEIIKIMCFTFRTQASESCRILFKRETLRPCLLKFQRTWPPDPEEKIWSFELFQH